MRPEKQFVVARRGVSNRAPYGSDGLYWERHFVRQLAGIGISDCLDQTWQCAIKEWGGSARHFARFEAPVCPRSLVDAPQT